MIYSELIIKGSKAVPGFNILPFNKKGRAKNG